MLSYASKEAVEETLHLDDPKLGFDARKVYP